MDVVPNSVQLYILYFAMIFLIGTLVSALAAKLGISNVFFLVFAGMVLRFSGLVIIPAEAILVISILTMIIITFDSTDRLKLREIEKFTSYSIRIVIVFFFLNLVVLSAAAFFLFRINSDPFISVVLLFIFSCLMYGIDHSVTLEALKKRNSKILKILEIESLLNRPLTIIGPLVLLNYLSSIYGASDMGASSGVLLYVNQIGLGLLVGAIGGIMVVAVLKYISNEELSNLVVVTSCIVIYAFTDMLRSEGAIALTVFALIFGNLHVKHKLALEKFTSIFVYIFDIFVFILFGTVLVVSFSEIMKGTLLFLVYIAIRLVSVFISFINSGVSVKEKIFMSLNLPKGIDVAVIILIMTAYFQKFEGVSSIIELSLLFSLYSIILSNVLTIFTGYFLGRENVVQEQRN